MFPNDVDFAESKPKEELNKTRLGRSFKFNFKTGQHEVIDGKVVECTELEAIEQWVALLIRTKLDKYAVYQNTGFGTTWENYIGIRNLPTGFIESELEREIRESIKKLNPAIETIENFQAARTTRGLDITFDVNLTNKEVLGVKVNV